MIPNGTAIIRVEQGDDRIISVTRGDRIVREQVVHFINPEEKYPRRCIARLPDDKHIAYPPGDYLIAAKGIRINRYDNMEINPFQLHLVPLPPMNAEKK